MNRNSHEVNGNSNGVYSLKSRGHTKLEPLQRNGNAPSSSNSTDLDTTTTSPLNLSVRSSSSVESSASLKKPAEVAKQKEYMWQSRQSPQSETIRVTADDAPAQISGSSRNRKQMRNEQPPKGRLLCMGTSLPPVSPEVDQTPGQKESSLMQTPDAGRGSGRTPPMEALSASPGAQHSNTWSRSDSRFGSGHPERPEQRGSQSDDGSVAALLELTTGSLNTTTTSSQANGGDRGRRLQSPRSPKWNASVTSEIAIVPNVARRNSVRSGGRGESSLEPTRGLRNLTNVLTPFASKLAMNSFQLSKSDEPVMVPSIIEGTILFVDLTGYSAAAKELEEKGAFALSETVNSYFSKIVECVVDQFGGQIVNFAGDAIVAIWYESAHLPCTAGHCAMELQRSYGEHPVAGTDLMFRLHMGIVHGELKSTVFVCDHAKHMQKHFPMISGAPMLEIGDAVSTAKSGEVCITEAVMQRMCSGVELVETYRDKTSSVSGPGSPTNSDAGSQLASTNNQSTPSSSETGSAKDARVRGSRWTRRKAQKDTSESPLFKLLGFRGDMHSCSHSVLVGQDGDTPKDDSIGIRADHEQRELNLTKFVHPRIAERLKHGLLQSHLAEMRLLTVLFIHKTDPDVEVADWFNEVQATLDRFRCPIVQIIDDDKGIHLIAAINLFFGDREPAVTGIRLAQTLVQRETGSTIGMACGMTFCGVVGSSLASRWDIVGPPCVRACRLMQYGVAARESVVIGESVLNYTADASLTVKFAEVGIKGCDEPVPVYKIAEVDTKVLSCITSATRSCAAVHVAPFMKIQRLAVNAKRQTCGVIIKGGPDSGKAFLSVRSVHGTGITPCLHVAVPGCSELSVLETLSEWFSHHIDADVRLTAERVGFALGKRHTIRALRLGIELVQLILAKNFKFAMVIRQAQILDSTSLSFLRQALQQEVESSGRLLVFLTVVPQNGAPSAKAIKDILDGGEDESGDDAAVMVELGNLSEIETSALIEHRLGWRSAEDFSDLVLKKSGQVAGFVDKLVSYVEKSKLISITQKGVVVASPQVLRNLLTERWITISPAVCAKASQLIDAITTTQKTLLKCLSVLDVPYRPCGEMILVSVMSQLVTSSQIHKVARDLDVLQDLALIQRTQQTDELGDVCAYVAFSTPAVADVVKSITLPDQCKQVAHMAAVELGFVGAGLDFEPESIEEVFTVAHYQWLAGMEDQAKVSFRRAWEAVRIEATKDLHLENIRDRPLHRVMLTDLDHLQVNIKALFSGDTEVDPEVPFQRPELMPEHIIKLNTFRPPFSLGGLTHAWRTTAVTLRTLAVNAANGTTMSSSTLIEAHTVVNGYLRFVKIVDKNVGFNCPVNERDLIFKWLKNGTFEQVCKNATEFLEFFETVLTPRVEAAHAHIEKMRCEPTLPERKKAFWVGADREGMKSALEATLRDWDTSRVLAVRNGLMRMATLPKNPDQTLEFQRDSYLKNRTFPLICFPSLMFTNLSLFWDD